MVAISTRVFDPACCRLVAMYYCDFRGPPTLSGCCLSLEQHTYIRISIAQCIVMGTSDLIRSAVYSSLLAWLGCGAR